MRHPLRWLALIALDRAELPSFEKLAAWYAEHYPEAPQPVLSGTTEHLLTISVGDLTAAVTVVGRPIPWSQVEGPCATAWYWPEAAERLRDHAAHLFIAVIDEGGPAVEKAELLTRLSAAVAATMPTGGIFWGPGRLVHEPAAFLEQVRTMSRADLPLFLWVDFRVERADDAGNIRLFTTGLESLGGSEIEVANFTGPPQQLLEHAYNFAHYQLATPKKIRDGERVGLAENVEATVQRAPSMFGGTEEVLRLELEGPSEAAFTLGE